MTAGSRRRLVAVLVLGSAATATPAAAQPLRVAVRPTSVAPGGSVALRVRGAGSGKACRVRARPAVLAGRLRRVGTYAVASDAPAWPVLLRVRCGGREASAALSVVTPSGGPLAGVAGVGDLTLVLYGGTTGSGRTEVHALSGASAFTRRLVDLATVDALTGERQAASSLRADVDHDGIRDLATLTYGDADGPARLRILSGAGRFTQVVGDHPLPDPLPPAGDADYAFGLDADHDGQPDLAVVRYAGTASGRTEVRVYSGASGFATRVVDVVTGDLLRPSGTAQLSFDDLDRDGVEDLVRFDVAGTTGSGRVEVHALSGAGGYARDIADRATSAALEPPGVARFALADWDGDDVDDLVEMVFGRPTASGRTEVHVLSGASGFTQSIGDIATLYRTYPPGTAAFDLVTPARSPRG